MLYFVIHESLLNKMLQKL